MILLVEDNPHISEAFSLLLEDSGYRVRTALSGADAIRSVAEAAPLLVLLDLGLPDMGGLEVAREIRRQPAAGNVRIVALTGRALDADREAALAAGCAEFLTKPVPAATLLATVRRLLPG